jgi:hypothetical protein
MPTLSENLRALLGVVDGITAKGHSLDFDAPAALTSLRGRWTCRWCGKAVLVRSDETCYGSAMTEECCPLPKVGQVWESIESGLEGMQIEIVGADPAGETFGAKVIRKPVGLSYAGQIIVRRGRLQQPPAYKYGYKLIKDVE